MITRNVAKRLVREALAKNQWRRTHSTPDLDGTGCYVEKWSYFGMDIRFRGLTLRLEWGDCWMEITLPRMLLSQELRTARWQFDAYLVHELGWRLDSHSEYSRVYLTEMGTELLVQLLPVGDVVFNCPLPTDQVS